jgi:hypothetical protein
MVIATVWPLEPKVTAIASPAERRATATVEPVKCGVVTATAELVECRATAMVEPVKPWVIATVERGVTAERELTAMVERRSIAHQAP